VKSLKWGDGGIFERSTKSRSQDMQPVNLDAKPVLSIRIRCDDHSNVTFCVSQVLCRYHIYIYIYIYIQVTVISFLACFLVHAAGLIEKKVL
jgi:hypothetical protein